MKYFLSTVVWSRGSKWVEIGAGIDKPELVERTPQQDLIHTHSRHFANIRGQNRIEVLTYQLLQVDLVLKFLKFSHDLHITHRNGHSSSNGLRNISNVTSRRLLLYFVLGHIHLEAPERHFEVRFQQICQRRVDLRNHWGRQTLSSAHLPCFLFQQEQRYDFRRLMSNFLPWHINKRRNVDNLRRKIQFHIYQRWELLRTISLLRWSSHSSA